MGNELSGGWLLKPPLNFSMNPTSHAIISAILINDVQLSSEERSGLAALLGAAESQKEPKPFTSVISLNQEEASKMLGVSRTTAWRLKACGILKPVEISPGVERYYRQDIEALARDGYRSRISRRPKLAA